MVSASPPVRLGRCPLCLYQGSSGTSWNIWEGVWRAASVLAHPWRVLFCGSEGHCESFVAAGALLPFEIVTFSESGSPVDRIDAGCKDGPFEVVIAHRAWLAA